MLQNGTVLTSESGRDYRVCGLISSGTGQGDIYKVSSEGVFYAFKLFYAEDTEPMREQIQTLMKRGQACPEYVHPLDILWADERIGYIMELVPETYLSGSVLCNGIERDGYREELPFHIRISVLHRLAKALTVLYNANLAIMDLKFDNIKLDPQGWSIKILDTDTVVGSDGSRTLIEGTVGFMPPLTMRRKEVPSKDNDSFALAVMIFMTLMGSHPLIGALWEQPHACDNETYCFAEDPVYVWHPTDTRNRPTEEGVRTANKLSKYPSRFLAAMERTFVDGLFEREKRTTPEEWADVLREVYESSYCCVECGEEHFLGEDSSYCDGCGLALVKPLLARGDKAVPLFYGCTVTASELWSRGGDGKPFARVTSTPYRGKHGFLVENGTLTLCLPSGESIAFARGRVAPLFTNATYVYENQIFTVKEN